MTKKRILIIDDDRPLTNALRINLERTGDYEVCIENRSSDAISSARVFRPDLILLDIVMPELDGGDISGLLKEDPFLCDIPVLIMTALISNDETGSKMAISHGGRLMMAKPFRLEHLLSVVESQLMRAVTS